MSLDQFNACQQMSESGIETQTLKLAIIMCSVINFVGLDGQAIENPVDLVVVQDFLFEFAEIVESGSCH